MDLLIQHMLQHEIGSILIPTSKQYAAKTHPNTSARTVHARSCYNLPIMLDTIDEDDDLFLECNNRQLTLRQASIIPHRAGLDANHYRVLVIANDIQANPWVTSSNEANTICLYIVWNRTHPVKECDISGTGYFFISDWTWHVNHYREHPAHVNESRVVGEKQTSILSVSEVLKLLDETIKTLNQHSDLTIV